MMHHNVYRDVQHENMEELLLDLRGSSAHPLSAYAEDDDSETRVLDARVLAAVAPRVPAAVAPRVPAAGAPRVPAGVVPREPAGVVPREPAVAPGQARCAEVVVERAPAAAAPLAPPEMDLERLSLESGSLRMKRAVMAGSALAMTGVFVTLFAISSTKEDRVREAAWQRAGAAAIKADAVKAGAAKAGAAERATSAPDSTDEVPEPAPEPEPPARQRTRQRARGVPREAAAMLVDTEQRQSVESTSQRQASDEVRQRL